MSEYIEGPAPEAGSTGMTTRITTEAQQDTGDVPTTGNRAVDEVLRTLEGLEDRPVEEHVAVFEAAHEALRAALSDAGSRPDGPAGR